MKRFFLVAVVVVGALSLGASCQNPPPTVMTPADTALCAHLAAVGCSSGTDTSCGIALARLQVLEPIPSACLLDAGTKAAVVACGWECP